jgi:hypothetical protein
MALGLEKHPHGFQHLLFIIYQQYFSHSLKIHHTVIIVKLEALEGQSGAAWRHILKNFVGGSAQVAANQGAVA